ncbi:threonine/serine exporter family protein [Hathewaya histolytica]|uniref:Membrane spanning protein n=1 Tax=Hathewaya histolytica TaxID=1498 RepID=A0A4U9RLU1_HATHI|nr:threonine/serine exporter family protein [Hathewaya histolytica]VTQ92361.1 membrane spanning protein [Hathewaya histolytica]
MIKLLLDLFYAFLGSLGFCVLFNIRGKSIFVASIGGALGWFVYELFPLLGMGSTNNAIFMATIAISIYSEIMARIFKQPVTVFVIASMIPLVPGSGMYYTTFEAVNGNVDRAVAYGLKTLYDAGAIAIGIILVSTVARILKQKKFINIKFFSFKKSKKVNNK